MWEPVKAAAGTATATAGYWEGQASGVCESGQGRSKCKLNRTKGRTSKAKELVRVGLKVPGDFMSYNPWCHALLGVHTHDAATASPVLHLSKSCECWPHFHLWEKPLEVLRQQQQPVSMTNVKVNVKEKIPGRGQCALTPDQQEPVQTLLPCLGWGLAGEGILQMGLWIGS